MRQTAIEEKVGLSEFEDCVITEKMMTYIEAIEGQISCNMTGPRGIIEWPAHIDNIDVEGAAFAARLGIAVTKRDGKGWTGVQSLDGRDASGAPAKMVYVVAERDGPCGQIVGISYTRHRV